MTSRALGLIETIGLTAAFEAADAAAKSANVTLLGYENARGGGRITIKLLGDVGAVQAAVAAGSAAAMRVGQVASCLVIPRPHEELEVLIHQVDRGQIATAPAVSGPAPAAPPAAKAPAATPKPRPAAKAAPATKPAGPAPAVKRKVEPAKPAKPAATAKPAVAPARPVSAPPTPPTPPAPAASLELPAPADASPSQPSSPDRPEEPPAVS